MIRRYDTDPVDHDEKLGEAIEAYLALAEEGTPPDPESFASRYPDLGEDLRAALDGLALVQGLVGETSGPGHRLEAGQRVAGYRIVRELGRGGMAIVYEAVHVDLDRPVALKVLGTHAAPDSVGRRRFLNEARTAAGLHHTHIVPVFDVGQVGGLCYYAMQRIEGSGLDRVIRSLRRDRSSAAGSGGGATPPLSMPSGAGASTQGKKGVQDSTATWVAGDLSAAERRAAARGGSEHLLRELESPPFEPPRGAAYFRWVADLGRRAAEALGHAHARGVVHRDVKPSNILVDANGSIWVADFGLARRETDPGLTQSDSRLGTPRYMSPEQADNTPVDSRTDIYSLGATLYEMITLRPPFDGRSAAELHRQICLRDPVTPRQIDKRIPRDLETIVLKAMAKRAADRYATATELAEDLARFLAYEPVKARRIGPIGRLWRVAQRHPGITSVTVAAAAIVLAVATVAYVRVVQERDLARAATAETQMAMREQLLSQATTLRLSALTNRRERGLKLLARAAALGPEEAMRAKLRDEAVELLALHDVDARGRDLPTGKVQGLLFNAEGNRLVTLSDDGAELCAWDLAKRQPLLRHTLRTGSAETTSSAPAGRGGMMRAGRLAALGPYVAALWHNGRGIRLYDFSTGAAFNLGMGGREIAAIAASSDGQRLVTIERMPRDPRAPRPKDEGRPGPREEWRVKLWDPERHDAPLATLAEPAPPAENTRPGRPLVAISPDGDLIATGRSFESMVALWSKDGEPRGEVETRVRLSALALGPDNIMAAAGDGAIQLCQLDYRTSATSPIATHLTNLTTRQNYVSLIRFSPDATMIAVAGGMSSGVELWDLATDALVATLPASDAVSDLTFSANGHLLAAGGRGDSVSVWTLTDPIALVRLPEFKTLPRSLAFGPRGTLAMASWGGELRFFGPGQCPTARRLQEELKPSAVAFDAQYRFLAIEGNTIYRFRAADHQTLSSPRPLPDEAERFALPEPEDLRRPGGPGPGGPPPGPGRARDRQRPGGPGGGPGAQVLVARPSNGRLIVFARRNEIATWNPDGSQSPHRLALDGLSDAAPPPGTEGGRGRLGWPRFWRDVAVSPGGNRLFLINSDDDFSAWKLDGNRAYRLAWPRLSKATCVALSPDGLTLALGDKAGNVSLVDALSGALLAKLPRPAGQTEDRVSSLAFAPAGNELAVGTRDQTRVWSLGTDPQPLVTLPGHRGAVAAMAYNAQGSHLATAGADRVVALWDLARLKRELNSLGLGW